MKRHEFEKVIDLANEKLLTQDYDPCFACCACISMAASCLGFGAIRGDKLVKLFEELCRRHFSLYPSYSSNLFWLGPRIEAFLGYRSLVLGYFKEYVISENLHQKL